MSVDSKRMMQSIYDAMYGSLTGDVPGLSAERSVPPSSAFLTMLKPGLRIEPLLYTNAWSPANPDGSDVAAVCPPLICEKRHLDTIFSTIADQLKTIA